MASDKPVREHILKLLEGGHAHVTFEAAIKGIPAALRGKRPKGVEHSLWEILEHMRIAQWDILEFSRDPNHVSPEWPKGYWPSPDAQADMAMWNETIRQFRSDLAAMKAIVADPNTDLYQPIPHGYGGHTVLREALLIADHNAYHVGALVTTLQLLGAW